MENRPRVLVVDDEESIRGILNETLDMIGCEVIEAASAEEAMKEIKAHAFHLIMTDIRMPGLSGMDLLEKVRAIPLETEVIIMTSHASLETALQAMRLGAYDYLLKPFEELDWVAAVVQRALEKRRLEAENKRLVKELVQKNQDLAQATKKAAALLAAAALKQRGAEPRSEPPTEREFKIPVRDGATAFFSLPYFQEYLEQEILRARRYRHPFSLCAVQIEGGGEAPEREKILKDTAALIQKRVRQSDLAARSGNRFFLLLPETNKEWGAKVVNSIQRKLSEFGKIQHPPALVKMAIADYPRDADTTVGLMTLVETMIQQQKS